jgi:ankyrin repeat protein
MNSRQISTSAMSTWGMNTRGLAVLAAAWIAAILFTGCASVPTGTSEAERLLSAISVDDVGFVRDAVQSGKLRVNDLLRTPGFQEGAPLIVVAARYAALNTLRYLLSAGANVNARAATGETALMMASYFSNDDPQRLASSNAAHEQAAHILVEAGASLENAPNNYTPLSYAAYQGHNRIVRFLLERGARVDADAENDVIYVNTPLMMAAIQGHMETTVWLLRAGANARTRVYLGHTAAELAAKNNHGNVAGLLRCAESLAPGDSIAGRCLSR